MCVVVCLRTMGCGKSRHHSPEDSETDLKNTGSYNNSKNNSSKNNSKNGKKKASSEDKKQTDKTGDKEVAERSPSVRKISNGKARIKDTNDEIDFSLSSSPSNRAGASSSSTPADDDVTDRSNGANKIHNKQFLLEVPNEISKVDAPARSTCKDFKTITTSKAVHITTSQLEFFKMLDEKIEMGIDYQTSNEASEVSSLDDGYKL